MNSLPEVPRATRACPAPSAPARLLASRPPATSREHTGAESALHAERALLAVLLLQPNTFPAIKNLLEPEHFYVNANTHLYRTMLALHDSNSAIDTVSVREAMAQRGLLAAAGGDEYLLELTDTIPEAHHLLAYATIVHERATRRRLERACTDLARETRGSATTEQLITQLARTARALRDEFVPVRLRTAADLFAPPSLASPRAPRRPYLQTDLQAATGGWSPGDLVLIQHESAVDPTGFALELALAHARAGAWKGEGDLNSKDTAAAVAIVSLRQSTAELAKGLLHAATKPRDTACGGDALGQAARAEAQAELRTLPLLLQGIPPLSLEDVARALARHKRTRPFSFVLLHGLETWLQDPRHDVHARVLCTLSSLASLLQCPLLGLVEEGGAADAALADPTLTDNVFVLRMRQPDAGIALCPVRREGIDNKPTAEDAR